GGGLFEQQRVSRLALDRDTYRKLIVLADEDAGSLEHPSKIESRVEVGVAGGSVAQKRQADVVATTRLGRQRHTDRLRQLRADAARPRDHLDGAGALMAGHLPTLGDV